MTEPSIHDDDDTLGAREIRNTDTGNARRLVMANGARFRWVPAWERWLVYDGTRWVHDEAGQVVQAAKDVAHSLFTAASMLQGDDRKAVAKWAMQSENAARIDAAVRLARSEPGMTVSPDELDADPWALNCANGTVDLRTGKLRAHDPDDLITKTTGTDYDPTAGAPTWETFLEQVLPDVDVRDYLRVAVGYSTTGTTAEQVLLFLYGSGSNGKSVFTRIVQAALGEYAGQVSTDVLVKADSHPTGVADLHGRRLVIASELDDGRKLAEATVKALTGGDRIKARFMRRDFFEFEPSHTIWLAANHRPIVTGTDHAIWRRIKLIPFTVTIPDDEQDRGLVDKLRAELPGVLAWALRGCSSWQERGLVDPLAVQYATAGYRAEMDLIGTFVGDVCFTHEDAKVSASELYGAYTRWAGDAGEVPVSQKALGRQLTERGYDRRRWGPVRHWHWFGIGLTSVEVNP